jgi:hypothetical protein
MAVLKIPAVYMRGGASKGVFFQAADLPRDAQLRDRVLLRVLGSPDPHGRQADGMGGGSAGTSQVVVVGASSRVGCDVEFRCGQVALDRHEIVWSGGGSLAAAIGPYAIQQKLVSPREGTTVVRLWQPDAGMRLDAHVEVRGGEVLEAGAFAEESMPFPAAEVRLDFIDEQARSVLPTRSIQDTLAAGDLGLVPASLIDTGDAAIFVRAADIGLTGREKLESLERNSKVLGRLGTLRVEGAVAMGMSRTRAEKEGARLPRLVWVAPPVGYRTAGGQEVARDSMDVLARGYGNDGLDRSFGVRHAISVAVAAALPGSVVSQVARTLPGVATRIGHPSGVQSAWAAVRRHTAEWVMEQATISRSARCLMSGWVHIPE